MKREHAINQKKSLLLFFLILLYSITPMISMSSTKATTPLTSTTQNFFYSFKEALYLLATQIENAYRKDIFSKDEYEQYMKLIQELDPVIYQKLRTYEQEFKEPAFLKAVGREPTVLIPKKETHGQPMMVLPSLFDQPRKKQKRSLTRFLQSYNALSHSEFYQRQIAAETKALNDWSSYTFYDKCTHYAEIIKRNFGIRPNKFLHVKNVSEKEPIQFPTDEYERYMKLIEDISPSVYKKLKKYELVFSEPALLKAHWPTDPPIEEKNGYPIIVLYLSAHESEESQKKTLELGINFYKRYMPLKKRRRVLKLIGSLAPELYQEFIAIDPTGENHLAFDSKHTNASANYSHQDGLPVITLGRDIINAPQEELRFVLGHELGHYALGHFKHHYPVHSRLRSHQDLTQIPTQKEKTNEFKFEETFCLAYSRIKENEADRFSILSLGTNIDAAIAWFQNNALERDEQYEIENKPLPTTLTITHPHDEVRIKHFESLRREVEIQKAQSEKPAPIDWNALIENYKNSSYEELQKAL